MAQTKSLDEISRQRRWQMKKIGEGRCMICGKPRGMFSDRCDQHHMKKVNEQRMRRTIHRAVEEVKAQ